MEKNISIFPNPTSDRINLDLELNSPAELTINIFNNIGALIYQDYDYAFGELNKECDLSNYHQGIYFINIISMLLYTNNNL